MVCSKYDRNRTIPGRVIHDFANFCTRYVSAVTLTFDPMTLNFCNTSGVMCPNCTKYERSRTICGRVIRDVNKDKFQNPMPRPSQGLGPSLPRPRPLFPQGLFKDFCWSPWNATIQNTPWYDHNIMTLVLQSVQTLSTLSIFAVAGPTIGMSWGIISWNFMGSRPTIYVKIWDY